MGMNEVTGKKIILELTNGNKYFGTLNSVENIGNGLIFLELIDRNGVYNLFASGEVLRIEVEQ